MQPMLVQTQRTSWVSWIVPGNANAGPQVRHIECSYRGKHTFRAKQYAYQFPRSVVYEGCTLYDAVSAADFCVNDPADGTTNAANFPPVTFRDATKTAEAVTTFTSYRSYTDCTANPQSSNANIGQRWVRFSFGATPGICGSGSSMYLTLPPYVSVKAVRAFKATRTTGSTTSDWSITVKDTAQSPATLATFNTTSVSGSSTWRLGFDATIDLKAGAPSGSLASPYWTSSAQRSFVCTVAGTGNGNDILPAPYSFVEMLVEG